MEDKLANQDNLIDDGMEYYKINNKLLQNYIDGDIQNILNAFFIHSIIDGKLKHYVAYDYNVEVFYACGNAKIILYSNITAKNQFNSQLEGYGISLNDTSIFEPITAKEYYSLLN